MDWGELARQQHGLVRRDQLRSTGLSDSAISRLTGSAALTAVARGVFLVRGAPMTYQAALWSAVLSSGGCLGFASAAHLWGLIDDEPPLAHVVVEHRRRVVSHPTVRVHRVFAPAITTRDGLPVTTRPWTLLDHLGTLGHTDAQRLADRAIQRGWLEPADLERRLRDYPHRYGNRVLRQLACSLGDGAAAQSERVLHRILNRAAITGWVANYTIWSNGRIVAVVDAALVDAKVAIEVDGWAYHSDVERFQRDRRRQNDLIGLGWTVLRFTWADLTHRPAYVARTISGVL